MSAAVAALLVLPSAPAYAKPEVSIRPEVVRLPVEETQGLHFNRLTTADGLSQARVGQITQDGLGFIWFGTQYGLNRYDGYDFKLYVHQPGNPRSPAGTVVYSLLTDKDGFIWISWSSGLDRFDPATETFTHYFTNGEGPQNSITVVHMSQDRQGVVWLATGSGLRGIDPRRKGVIRFQHTADPDSLPSNDVNWSGEDRQGRFWVGTAKGLCEFDRTSGKVLRTIPLADPFRIQMFQDHRGTLWIASATGTGLALFDPGTNVLTRYTFYQDDAKLTGISGVANIAEDRDGYLWMGTARSGLLRLDRERRRFQHFGNPQDGSNTTTGNDITAFFMDRDENLWTGLNSGGVHYFGNGLQRFEAFRHIPGDPNSLTRDFVNATLRDKDGTLWIGNYGGLNRIDRVTRRREVIDLGFGKNPTVISLAQTSDGAIWIGTFSRGLTRYDPKTKAIEHFLHDPADPRSLSNDEVHRILVDRKQNVWIGTDDGLDRFDPAARSFVTHKLQPENRFGQAYVSMAEDAKGGLWLGTGYSGLHHFDPISGKLELVLQKTDDPNGLRDNQVQSVMVSRTGALWLGTANGLQHFEPRTGTLRAYDTRNGMPANSISCILEDERGAIWMSTTKGLTEFVPDTATFTNYSMIDELAGNDLTGWGACSRSSDGEMFFGGFDGAIGFHPAILQAKPSKTTLALTDITIDGVDASIGPGRPLDRAIAYAKKITLSHRQTSFSVSFAGLNYGNSRATRYRYRLEGLDEGWHEAPSSIRQATYTSLSPGRYLLRVQMAADRGDWQLPGISLDVSVLPPWWETWWFRTLCILNLASVVWWAVRARLRYLTREITLQVEARNNERLRIAGDLHDTLLQGLLGASYQISVMQDQLARDAKALPLLDHVSELLRQLVAEGRNAVKGLRTWNFDDNDLECAIASVPGDLQIIARSAPCGPGG